MPAATVQFYDVVLFFHISGVVLAFGPMFGYAVIQAVAERTNPRSVPTVMQGFSTVDRFLVTPASILVLATGVYLTVDAWSFGDFFVNAGLISVIVLLGLLHGFFLPRERKLAALAERDIADAGAGDVKLSPEYVTASRLAGRVGTIAGLIVILTIYFMTAKPFL